MNSSHINTKTCIILLFFFFINIVFYSNICCDELDDPFEITKIYTKSDLVLFRGYLDCDGVRYLEINWAKMVGRTFFYKVGDFIRGYKIIKVIGDKDSSYVLLQKNNQESIKFVKNKIAYINEKYANIQIKAINKTQEIHIDSEIDYYFNSTRIMLKVISITDNEVVYKDKNDNTNSVFLK